MVLARLMVVVVLGVWGLAQAHPAPVRAADPTWASVSVGVTNTASDSFLVSDDGLYCQYPTDFPLKAGSDVTLTAALTDEPAVDTLNSLIAETYQEGDPSLDDGCAIWAEFASVPMSPSYVIEISADPTDAATDRATYTGDMVVVLMFWTREFETGIGPDGGPACAPTAASAMRPGGAFQTEPQGEPVNDPAIVGDVIGDVCRVSLILLVPPSAEITVALGDAHLSPASIQA